MKLVRNSLILLLFTTSILLAQRTPRVTSGIDLGVGYLDEAWVPSVTYHQELSLNHFPWFRIGWGLRAWGYYAGKTNLLPQNNRYSNDTLKFGKITSNGASLLAGANFRFGKFDIGANTDIISIAFGLRRKALYTKDYVFEDDDAGYYNKSVRSSPSFFSALPLALENQNGQSELYVRYWITSRIGVKLGYNVGRVTYTTEDKLDSGQNRFSKTYGVPYAAISFPLHD